MRSTGKHVRNRRRPQGTFTEALTSSSPSFRPRRAGRERGRGAEGRRRPVSLLTACSNAPGVACCCPAPGPDPAAPNSNSCRGRLTGTSGSSGPLRLGCSIMAVTTLLGGATDRAAGLSAAQLAATEFFPQNFRRRVTNRFPTFPSATPSEYTLEIGSF